MFGTAHWGRHWSRRFRSHFRALTAVAVLAATSVAAVPIVVASASSAASAKRIGCASAGRPRDPAGQDQACLADHPGEQVV